MRVPQLPSEVAGVYARFGRRLGRPTSIRLVRDEAGQTLTEYALILMLISLVAIAALTSIGQSVNSFLAGIASQV